MDAEKHDGHFLNVFVLFCTLVAFMIACTEFNKRLELQHDHILEEMVEDLIEHKTGIDVDLSYETPEK